MKTTLYASTLLYQAIAASPLKTAINGGVYKDERPKDSAKEDVVINTITIDSGSAQRAVCNVNIHVPRELSGKINHTRINVLAELAKVILDEAYATAHNFWTENQSLIVDEIDCYYNFRLRFKIHNSN